MSHLSNTGMASKKISATSNTIQGADKVPVNRINRFLVHLLPKIAVDLA